MDDKRRIELIEYHVKSTKELLEGFEDEEMKAKLFYYQVGTMFKWSASFSSTLNSILEAVGRLKVGL